MSLPLFDNVIVSAAPSIDGPVRIHEGSAPTAAHSRARLSTASAPFDLDGDDRPKSHRPPPVRSGDPRYWAWWNGFTRAASEQSAPAAEADADVTRYAQEGFRIGKLFRPLDVVKEKR